MGCCSGMIKCLLFVFNILFWIAGGVILGLGIYLRVGNNVEMVLTFGGLNLYFAGSYILIAAGAAMFLVGFFGCCGAIQESKCLLWMYFISLVIIFVLEMGVGIWALTNQDSFESAMTSSLDEQTPIVYIDSENSYSSSVIATEKNFQCCGLTQGCSDWTKGIAYGCGCNKDEHPDGVCSSPPRGCKSDPLSESSLIYQDNCYDSVYTFIMKNLNIIAGVAIGIGLAEIFGMVFSMIMICNRKKTEYAY